MSDVWSNNKSSGTDSQVFCSQSTFDLNEPRFKVASHLIVIKRPLEWSKLWKYCQRYVQENIWMNFECICFCVELFKDEKYVLIVGLLFSVLAWSWSFLWSLFNFDSDYLDRKQQQLKFIFHMFESQKLSDRWGQIHIQSSFTLEEDLLAW